MNISYNALGGDAIQHLANALRVNQGLKKLELDISGNALRNGSIQHIAHALQVNQHLKRLELANCSITDDGLCCLVKSIHNHCALNALLLHNSHRKFENAITENVIPVLIECLQLQSSHTLTELYLPDNFELARSLHDIREAINDIRKKSGVPVLEVKLR